MTTAFIGSYPLKLPKTRFADAVGSSRLTSIDELVNPANTITRQAILLQHPILAVNRCDHGKSLRTALKLQKRWRRMDRGRDEMKALEPQRLRVLFYYVLALLFMAAFLMEKHMKAPTAIVFTTGLAAAILLLAGIRGRYNLTD